MDTLIFNLPGDWTRPYLLFRLLEVVECPWNVDDTGFCNPTTGERVMLGYGPRIPGLAEQFAQGTDASRPPLSDEVLEALEAHQGMFQVQGKVDSDKLLSLRTTLRAVNAVVDGGATAVQCMHSGLVHEADAFQALMHAVDDAGDDRAALLQAMYALVVRYQFGKLPMTFGMACLGLPDLVLAEPTQADRAIGRMERAALHDAGLLGRAVPDARGLPEFGRNPYGMVVLHA